MASRPAFAALGCLQCRGRVLRAITANSNQILRAPALAPAVPLRPHNLRRAFSTLPPDAPKPTTEPGTEEAVSTTPEAIPTTNEGIEESEVGEDTPWFLQVDPPTHAPTQHVSPLPDLPESPPAILEPPMKYVYEEMGLDDLSLLDLRAMDPPPALGPNLLMLFATARSERHLHVSSSRLVKWLRHTHRIESSADGLIGPGELKTKLRRMRRKAKLLGSSATITPGGDDGITTGWICVNLGTLGAKYGEDAHFDAEGNMSGFGAPVSGSTIVVQVMTDARRKELDLERLWSQQLTRSEVQTQNLADGARFEHRFGQLPRTTDRSVKGSSAIPQQKRLFSTSLNRTMPYAPEPTTSPPAHRSRGPKHVAKERSSPSPATLPEIRQYLDSVRWEGIRVDREKCLHLLELIFRAPFTEDNHSQTQADLATELITTMSERGIPIMEPDVISIIIESIAASGARGEKIEAIQSNLELVLLQATSSCPSPADAMRLMRAYLIQGNWDKLWDIWYTLPRYSQRRGPEMYEFLFQQTAETGDKLRCIEVLRKCVEEMLTEEPPVMPTEAVWQAVRKCIRVADPAAEAVAKNIETMGATSASKVNSLEFVKIWQQLDSIRKGL
ncbi:ATPase synthesis protein mitochondrial [Colletotrichum kahawae]|uniref:ATPase synthesis protein 25 n=1 Tax=Colletotrichum kahawae TaxID=34407 RepID=A0AAE0DAP2_COLKA|nr:ATPase synthesis protein mitochondrial [Colletotrichum kahawae]